MVLALISFLYPSRWPNLKDTFCPRLVQISHGALKPLLSISTLHVFHALRVLLMILSTC
jgi:hypothetical protein